MKKETYAMYGDILREELLLAMGCTEPVAVAYAGAIARSVLDKPQSIRKCELYVSAKKPNRRCAAALWRYIRHPMTRFFTLRFA